MYMNKYFEGDTAQKFIWIWTSQFLFPWQSKRKIW